MATNFDKYRIHVYIYLKNDNQFYKYRIYMTTNSDKYRIYIDYKFRQVPNIRLPILQIPKDK